MSARWLSLFVAALAALGCQETRPKDEPPGVAEVSRMKDPEKKKLALLALIQSGPDTPEPYFLLGDLYERQGNYVLAERHYRTLAELAPPDTFTGPYYRVGRSLALQARYEEACEWLERCAAVPQATPDMYVLNPDYREAHYLLGMVANAQQDSSRMVFHLKEFLRLGGERQRIARHLGQLAMAETE